MLAYRQLGNWVSGSPDEKVAKKIPSTARILIERGKRETVQNQAEAVGISRGRDGRVIDCLINYPLNPSSLDDLLGENLIQHRHRGQSDGRGNQGHSFVSCSILGLP